MYVLLAWLETLKTLRPHCMGHIGGLCICMYCCSLQCLTGLVGNTGWYPDLSCTIAVPQNLVISYSILFTSSWSFQPRGCWGKEHCQGCHPTNLWCPLLSYICFFGSSFLSKSSSGHRSSPGVAAWPKRQPPGCKRSSPGANVPSLKHILCTNMRRGCGSFALLEQVQLKNSVAA